MQHSTKAASLPPKSDTGQGNQATLISRLVTLVQCAAREQQTTATICGEAPAQTMRKIAAESRVVVQVQGGEAGCSLQGAGIRSKLLSLPFRVSPFEPSFHLSSRDRSFFQSDSNLEFWTVSRSTF